MASEAIIREDCLFNLVGEVVDIDDDVLDAEALQIPNVPFQQRAPVHRSQSLWVIVCKRLEPCAETGSEEECFHAAKVAT